MESHEALPEVEMCLAGADDDVLASVAQYVMCGGMGGALFVQLMGLMGRTGVRKGEIAYERPERKGW